MLDGYTKVINIRIKGKIYFTCLFREGFNHFIGNTFVQSEGVFSSCRI